MPFFDPTFNRVLVTVTRPDDVQRVYEYMKAWLNSVSVPEPDEQGRMDIGIDQATNTEAAAGIRAVLDREWPDSAEWIEVEPTNRRPYT